MLKHEVVSNEVLNDKFILITLKAKGKIDFKIGQFVLIKVGKSITRAYSIASTPEELPFWKIFVDITPGGPGTTYLKKLKPKDIIETTLPSGQFILGGKSNCYIFGATGCGIAPFIPMIESLLEKDKKVHLFWGLRHKKEIALKHVLSDWIKNKNFEYEVILSQPEEAWEGKTGHISQYLLNKAKSMNKTNYNIYLSGSRNFINEVSLLLQDNKIPAKKIFFEACY